MSETNSPNSRVNIAFGKERLKHRQPGRETGPHLSRQVDMARRGRTPESGAMHYGLFLQNQKPGRSSHTQLDLINGEIMKTPYLRFIASAFALFLGVAANAFAGVPPTGVIVVDTSGKVAFKGATDARATFATANLPPGDYVVQFHSKNGFLKGNKYLLVIAAGRKKVIADAVLGEKIDGAGVAMRLSVEGGQQITGQMAVDQVVASPGSSKVKVIDGKRYVWVKARTGSHLGDHWEEEGLAAARNVATMSIEKLRQIQDRSFEGSLLDRHPGHVHDVMAGRPH